MVNKVGDADVLDKLLTADEMFVARVENSRSSGAILDMTGGTERAYFDNQWAPGPLRKHLDYRS